MRQAFLAKFSLTSDQVPLLSFDTGVVDSPFEDASAQHAPSATSSERGSAGPALLKVRIHQQAGFGTADSHPGSADTTRGGEGGLCDGIFEPQSKFWQMWGNVAWQKTYPREHKCWGNAVEAKAFFADIAAGKECDYNWYEGAQGPLGDEFARPGFSSPAPALFGFDESIFSFCSELLGEGKHFDGSGDFNNELAQRCVKANENILRLLSDRVPWSMCQNMRWTMCAINGLLPGQQGRTIHFATAPKDLGLGQWYQPDSWPCQDWGCPDGKFSVGDVFFAEVCIAHRICQNGADIFNVDAGQTMSCDIDQNAFNQLASQLQAIQ